MSAQQQPSSGILDLVGNTPLVRINRLDTGCCTLLVKLESQNPGGSIKDRIARSMIEAAEQSGQLQPGGTIVEATAGNTGLGLALIATLKGYKVILVVPDKMSREKIQHCKALGADVRITRSDVGKGHPEYYSDLAQRIAAERGGVYINQFENPANPLAHELTTGPEIWQQTGGHVDAVVCGVGSGGTLTGIGRYLKSRKPGVEMVLADPNGSILAPLINTGETIEAGSWLVEGIGEDFVPPILDLGLIGAAYSISDAESFAVARDLLQMEGILAGSSSGTLVAAALQYCREQTTPKTVVTFICDRGDKYLSKAFSAPWIREQGFDENETGLPETVGALLSRRHDDGETIFVRPDDTLKTAYKRMRTADVSQLPVLEGGEHVIGMIDENILLDTLADPNTAARTVRDCMGSDYPTLSPTDRINDVLSLTRHHPVFIVQDGPHFLGLLTKVDFLNHLFLRK